MQFYVLFGSMVHLPSETDNYYYSSGWEQNWDLHSQRHRTPMGKTNKNFKKKVYSSIFKFLKNCYKNNYFYYLYQWVHVIYSIFLNIYSEEKFTDSIQILFWIQEFCVCCGGNLCRVRLLVIYFSEKFQTLLLWTSLYCAGFTLHLFSSSKSQRL